VTGCGVVREPHRVREMFGAIARRYDLLNHLLSFNLDRRWRRRAVGQVAPPPGARILDLCGGTGDLTVELARAAPGALVVCCDFAHEMLLRAGSKFRRRAVEGRCIPLESDALRLPFASGCFDAVTVAFGVRNFADLSAGLREILRVLKPAGKLVVLEFSTPTAALLAPAYRFYLRRIVPRLGDRISGRGGPYRHLAESIAEFPEPPILAGRLREAGYAAAGWVTLTGGIVAIHTALKSP
jgi:demethylmenaquinone methyltransferase/2-methoxy-6-polyprenyl-1,4-benzoquinol methylase